MAACGLAWGLRYMTFAQKGERGSRNAPNLETIIMQILRTEDGGGAQIKKISRRHTRKPLVKNRECVVLVICCENGSLLYYVTDLPAIRFK